MPSDLTDSQLAAIARAYGSPQQSQAPESDPVSSTQSSLLASIQQANAMLTQRQLDQDYLGGNAGLTAGRDSANSNAGSVAQNMISTTLPEYGMLNRSSNPDPGFKAQLDALLAMGPQQYNGPSTNLATARNMNEKYRKDYLNEVANLAGMADLMRGPLSSAERQQQRDQSQLSHLGNIQAALATAQPRQVNDPALLTGMITAQGGVAAADSKALGDIGAAKAQAQGFIEGSKARAEGDIGAAMYNARGTIGAAMNSARGEIGAAQEKAKGDIRVAEITKQGSLLPNGQPAMTKEQQANAIENLSFTQEALRQADSLAKNYSDALVKPNWFSQKPERSAFISQAQGTFFNLYKALYGDDVAKEKMKQFTMNDSKEGKYGDLTDKGFNPEKFKATFSNMLAELTAKHEIQANALAQQAQYGVNLKPGTKEMGKLVDQTFDAVHKQDPSVLEKYKDKIYESNPTLAPTGYVPPKQVLDTEYERAKQAKAMFVAKRKAEAQAKIQAMPQLSSPSPQTINDTQPSSIPKIPGL